MGYWTAATVCEALALALSRELRFQFSFLESFEACEQGGAVVCSRRRRRRACGDKSVGRLGSFAEGVCEVGRSASVVVEGHAQVREALEAHA